jgi:glycosyltransferase involved in cell wall biosynthesis
VEKALMARILALCSRLPYPPREGHQLRTWHLLRALARAHEVTLLSCLRVDDAPDECAALQEILARLETFPIRSEHSRAALLGDAVKGLVGRQPFVAEKYYSRPMRQRVAELLPHCDLIHVDMLPLISMVPACRVPLVLDTHNVEHQLLRERAARETSLARRIFLRSQIAKLRRFEREACRRADHILACSPDDARELAALAPNTPISVVPNGVDVERAQQATNIAPDPARLIFVGQMSWFPNRDGVQWFLADVLPRILAARGDVQFTLVGKTAGLEVPQQLRAHVRLAGFVDDLEPELHAAAIYVVPLRCGSGTRLKVLEAMAFGKPIVTTSIGSQGIDLVSGEEALFADDARNFAAAVLDLLANPARAAQLGVAARAKAQSRYDWQAIGEEMLATYDGLLRPQPINRFPDELVNGSLSLAQR